jgi:hypothetical protein
MKHRSIIAFILLGAALFAAPQITHDILSFKSAVGARIRGEIVHAFISLSKGDSNSEELAARPSNAQPVVCERENGDAQTSTKSKKSMERASAATRVELSTQQSRQEQTAMLVSPTLMTGGAADDSSDADTNVFDKNIIVGKAGELSQQILKQSELAMFISPDADVAAPVGTRVKNPTEKDLARQRRKEVETRRQAARFAASFDGKKFKEQASGVTILRELTAALPVAYEFHSDGELPRVKYVRLRRCAGAFSGATPISYTQKSARQTTLAPVRTAPQAPPAE